MIYTCEGLLKYQPHGKHLLNASSITQAQGSQDFTSIAITVFPASRVVTSR